MFGVAVLVGSIRMDRLEAQGINPYTVPGCCPALLGIVMHPARRPARPAQLGPRRRGARRAADAIDGGRSAGSALVIALILVYTVVLLGRGLPFWLGSALYVVASILLLQRRSGRSPAARVACATSPSPPPSASARASCIHYVFQELSWSGFP